LAEIEAVEADARAEAQDLERAAAVARAEAVVAREEREATERELADAAVESAEESAAFLEVARGYATQLSGHLFQAPVSIRIASLA
jgi:hypothetical protein